MTKILIIDDEKPIRNTLREILEYEKFQVDDAEDGLIGINLVKSTDYDVVLCDIKMPKMDGTEVLKQILEMKPNTSVVMISGHGNIETAVDALKKGAFDYIAKPLDLNRLLVTVRNALDRTTLVEETKVLKRQVSKGKDVDMIGESEEINKIKEMIQIFENTKLGKFKVNMKVGKTLGDL